MHNKCTYRVELTKKTSHSKSRAFSSKTPTKNNKNVTNTGQEKGGKKSEN